MSIKFGGQALIEGVMIRGRQYNTVAVRCPDGSIDIKSDSIGWKWTSPYRKIPFLRGILVLAETVYIGTKSLLYSSAVSTGESSDSVRSLDMVIVLTLSISIAIIVFFSHSIVCSILYFKVFECCVDTIDRGNFKSFFFYNLFTPYS